MIKDWRCIRARFKPVNDCIQPSVGAVIAANWQTPLRSLQRRSPQNKEQKAAKTREQQAQGLQMDNRCPG